MAFCDQLLAYLKTQALLATIVGIINLQILSNIGRSAE